MSNLKNKKILITCGPTWVPIDDVRVISNKSTGKLGQMLALDLAAIGAKVTLIEGPVAEKLKNDSVKVLGFHYFDELFSIIKKELKKNYDIVIHAAAVSDYRLEKKFENKISSKLKHLTLKLVPTIKIIEQIKKIDPKIQLIGFKLVSKIDKEIAKKVSENLVKKSGCDLVIANSTNKNKYSGYILNKKLEILTHKTSRREISKALIKTLQTNL